MRARARERHEPGGMNKLEARYYGELQGRTLGMVPELRSFRFEPMKLKLAPSTFYTPDFFVVTRDGTCEFHEVKGFWEDDARVKVKVAAEMWPEFRFVGVTWDRKAGWKYERLGVED